MSYTQSPQAMSYTFLNGNVSIPGSYNAGHLLLGTYHLWVDGSGKLRIKSSAPTTDTDGAIVGSQS
jgi:hypothetical protein